MQTSDILKSPIHRAAAIHITKPFCHPFHAMSNIIKQRKLCSEVHPVQLIVHERVKWENNGKAKNHLLKSEFPIIVLAGGVLVQLPKCTI